MFNNYCQSWLGFEKLHAPYYLQFWQGFEKIRVFTFNPDRILRWYMLLPSIQTGFWEATCSVTFNPDRVFRSYVFHNFLQSWQGFWEFVCLCWGLTSQSTILQSCRDGATASWVINQYFRGVKCLAQGHNTAAVGFEPPTSRSGVGHSTTESPRSPRVLRSYMLLPSILTGFWEATCCYLQSWQDFEKLNVVAFNPDRILRSYMLLPSILTGFWEATCCYLQIWQDFETLHVVTFNPDRVLRSYMLLPSILTEFWEAACCYLQIWQDFEKLHVLTFNPDRVLRCYMFHYFLKFLLFFLLLKFKVIQILLDYSVLHMRMYHIRHVMVMG